MWVSRAPRCSMPGGAVPRNAGNPAARSIAWSGNTAFAFTDGEPMCGIAGIVSTTRPDPALVRRMCEVIVHRGPDGDGFHSDEHAALGMRRLAIIDLASGAHPVYREDGQVVPVFNGENFNFAELGQDLAARGLRLRGTGDSECLVH